MSDKPSSQLIVTNLSKQRVGMLEVVTGASSGIRVLARMVSFAISNQQSFGDHPLGPAKCSGHEETERSYLQKLSKPELSCPC
jgi:hypothetical protein